MTYYIRTSSRDRIGCRWDRYSIVDAKNKTAIRNRYKGTGIRVENIYTEEELEKLSEKAQSVYRSGLDYRE